MKERLKQILQKTVERCFKSGALTEMSIPDYVIEIPADPSHGHFASNLCMKMASGQKRSPREIASIILDNLADEENFIEKATVAGPGFINFWISEKEWQKTVAEILNSKDTYGSSSVGRGENILVEFVSANPTGPLHVGHARGAALGDTLCRILAFCGYNVVREFYINDAGMQIRMLGESIYSRIMQMSDPEYPFPENGYHGNYINDLAKRLADVVSDMPKEDAILFCANKGREIMLLNIQQDLKEFRTDFDVWFSEKDLFESGTLKATLDKIRDAGRIYEKDGAEWIRTSDFGDDKDRVIRKADGQFTYFASDIAYHLNKRGRGFQRAINIWGADHHGYVPRLRAALLAHGVPEDWLSVVLLQLVKLWKDGNEIKMSKRSGDFVTIRELMDEVGVDAMRFVFLTKHHNSPLDFDIDLVKRQDSENPVYYVQYAHARICSIFRKAEQEGIVLPDSPEGLLELLVLDEERALIRLLGEFPVLVREIAMTLEPHRLTYYLTLVASAFHRYFNLGNKKGEHRIITDNKALTHARLFLIDAVRIVVANGLRLLGIDAPTQM